MKKFSLREIRQLKADKASLVAIFERLVLTPEKGDKGDKGDPGKDGYTPIKGIDYHDGKKGERGLPGKKGKDGYTPVKGVDYFDGKKGDKGDPGKKGKDGRPDTATQIKNKLESLKGEDRLDAKAIKNIDKYASNIFRQLAVTAPSTGGSVTWAQILGDPSSSTTLVALLAGYEPVVVAGTTSQYYRGDKSWQTLDKTAIGLSNVDNTSDVNKPISTLVQAALDLKANQSTTYTKTEADTLLSAKQNSDADLSTIASINVNTGSGVLASDGSGWIYKTYSALKTAMAFVKGDVGLGNVDNTSDANKPVSTAQQAALDLKLDINKTGIAKTSGGTQQYGLPGTLFTGIGTSTLNAGEDRYTILYVPYAVTITSFKFEVTTPGPASNANVRVGIYKADTDMQPTAALAPVYDSGDIAVASLFTGVKTVSSLSIPLARGAYLIAMNCDVQMIIRVFTSPTPVVLTGLGASGLAQRFSVTRSYASFPTPGTKWTTLATATGGMIQPIVMEWTE